MDNNQQYFTIKLCRNERTVIKQNQSQLQTYIFIYLLESEESAKLYDHKGSKTTFLGQKRAPEIAI